MIIKSSVLEAHRQLFVGIFKDALKDADPEWKKVATRVTSNTKENSYGWLEKFPQLRIWAGERVIKDMKEKGYNILNDLFEGTVGVARTDIEDDNLGIYTPMFEAMGQESHDHVDRNIFALLNAGFSSLCYDGQNFFDTDHPVNPEVDGSGVDVSFSNIVNPLVTNKPAWFLLDTSRPLKPLIFQERTPAELEVIKDSKQSTVFMTDKYLYGVRARRAFGYGFWQMAVACRDDLNEANFKAARARMRSITRDGGDKLGLKPSLLVVNEDNISTAEDLIMTNTKANGAGNPLYKSVEVLDSRWL